MELNLNEVFMAGRRSGKSSMVWAYMRWELEMRERFAYYCRSEQPPRPHLSWEMVRWLGTRGVPSP